MKEHPIIMPEPMPQLGEIKKCKDVGWKGYGKVVWHACIVCGKERWVLLLKDKPLSLRCLQCGLQNRLLTTHNKHHCWKGGRIKTKDGYIRIKLQPDDFFYPMADCVGYVYEHRLVVAKAFNRCLLPWETIHHKEGYARDDNRYPETLELLPNPHKHDALTRMTNYIRKLEGYIAELQGRVTLLEAENILLKSYGDTKSDKQAHY